MPTALIWLLWLIAATSFAAMFHFSVSLLAGHSNENAWLETKTLLGFVAGVISATVALGGTIITRSPSETILILLSVGVARLFLFGLSFPAAEYWKAFRDRTAKMGNRYPGRFS